jgi:2-keto-4-pentenoate hydratase/2-oxohepta-3-ene-1,7-dioic acid hydratase in catechol pathway
MERPRIPITCWRRPLPTYDTVRAGGLELQAGDVQRWLSPATPTKIIADHLTYRSRAEEYRMERLPNEPTYFMKPPSSLSGHLASVYRSPGCRFLNYEGEVAMVSGRRCHRLITLEPGDVLLTGTPAHSRPVEPGDVGAVEVEGIGRLENTVVQSDAVLPDVGEQPAVTAQTLHVALTMPEDEAERTWG